MSDAPRRGPGSDLDPGPRGRLPPLDRLWWWLPPLVVVVVTRVVDAVILLVLGRDQVALDLHQGFHLVEPTNADPGYFTVVENWDGQWYRTIAEDGYPVPLPRDSEGEVTQNPWAFYPALPFLARAGMALTGLPFGVAASTISLLASTVGLVLLYRLIAERGGRYVALLTTAAISASPAASVLQTAYTEGLSLLMIVLALDALARRRYGLLAFVAIALAFTRPVTLALVPVIAVHGWWRWRRDPAFTVSDASRIAAAGVVTGLSFGLWPLVAALATSQPDAYLATQQAWVLDDSGWQTWGLQLLGGLGPSAAADVAIVVGLAAAILLQSAARLWPMELRMWALSYGAFLLATTRPTPSITRYSLLLLIVWWPFPGLGRRWHRAGQTALLAAVLLVGALLQYAWLEEHFVFTLDRLAYP